MLSMVFSCSLISFSTFVSSDLFLPWSVARLLMDGQCSVYAISLIPLMKVIIIIIITEMIFMVLSSWQSHCKSSPGSFDECRLSAEVAANPQTKPTDLDCESARNGSYRPHPPSPFIIIYYSALKLILILPSHRG